MREQLEEEEEECLTIIRENCELCCSEARRQHLAQRLVSHAALHHVGKLVRSLHDPLPRLVDVLEAFGLLDEGKTNVELRLREDVISNMRRDDHVT